MPLYRAFAPIAVKVKDTFRKVLARDAPPRTIIIYAHEIGLYICVLAYPIHETAVYNRILAVPARKSYGFFKSGTTFQETVPLFRVSAIPTAVLAIVAEK